MATDSVSAWSKGYYLPLNLIIIRKRVIYVAELNEVGKCYSFLINAGFLRPL